MLYSIRFPSSTEVWTRSFLRSLPALRVLLLRAKWLTTQNHKMTLEISSTSWSTRHFTWSVHVSTILLYYITRRLTCPEGSHSMASRKRPAGWREGANLPPAEAEWEPEGLRGHPSSALWSASCLLHCTCLSLSFLLPQGMLMMMGERGRRSPVHHHFYAN